METSSPGCECLLKESGRRRLASRLEPTSKLAAAVREDLLTSNELKQFLSQQNKEKMLVTSRVVVARWEQKHYLEERTGLNLLFLRALFRRRWHKNGNDLEYDFAGYVRVMKWRLLLGVLDRILTRVIECSMMTQRRILSRQARRKLKCLEPKLHL